MEIDIDLKLRFTTEVTDKNYPENSNYPTRKKVLCFTHAVLAASKGDIVEASIEQYDSEYDMRSWFCEECN